MLPVTAKEVAMLALSGDKGPNVKGHEDQGVGNEILHHARKTHSPALFITH
jgi:hypothetical protein